MHYPSFFLRLCLTLLVVFWSSWFVIATTINMRTTRPMCTTRPVCTTKPTCTTRQNKAKEHEMDFQLLCFYLNNCIRNFEAVTKYWSFFQHFDTLIVVSFLKLIMISFFFLSCRWKNKKRRRMAWANRTKN